MPEYYEIKIKGHLDAHWSEWFAGMTADPPGRRRDPAFRPAARPGGAARAARAHPRPQPDPDLGKPAAAQPAHQDDHHA